MARPLTQIEKQISDLAPLAAFVITYFVGGLYWATAVTIAATALSLVIVYAITGKVTKLAAFTLALLVVFGGLTLYLNDPKYFKLKVTVINLIFSVLILGGLAFKRLFLKDILGEAMAMPDAAWRNLSLRWGVFFAVLAIANELVWRNFPEPTWVLFKFPGLLIATALFALANAPYMMRHMTHPEENSSANG